MSKIVAVGVIKNCADVIEACVRGNANLVDEFYFLDNMSTDNTVSILNSLQEEGFKIKLFQDDVLGHAQREKTEKLVYEALQSSAPDFIIPIDDDEVVVPETGMDYSSVRNKIESLPQNNLYYIRWRVYCPTEWDNTDDICIFKRQLHCYADSIETGKKIIIPRGVLKSGNFHVAMGNHAAEGSDIKEHVVLPWLRMAHFPVRSEEQIISKSLVGWTNCLILPDRGSQDSYHWKVIYDIVKEERKIPLEILKLLSVFYVEGAKEDMEIEKHPIELPEASYISKYTTANEINVWKNYCSNVEMICEKYVELLKQQ